MNRFDIVHSAGARVAYFDADHIDREMVTANGAMDHRTITRAVIGKRVNLIGTEAFYGCTALESIDIPESVVSICDDALTGCRSLSAIAIPTNVAEIGNGAFQNCRSLRTVRLESATPPALGSCVFNQCVSLYAIEVPSGSLEAYRSAPGWEEHAGKITTSAFPSN